MKLEHPNSKHKVETDSPEEYLPQGWGEVEKPAAKAKSGDNEDD